ncbi:MAG: co-chaperone GroES [Candidatus Lloydbacteria bacterium RIFCSPHIGHO2_02_FULL_51_22]|uniref:Co-chaperonin GroES n=3 Tax=Candidatus Lloydiibacteriota TaxID=1817910 RepID=A0A1G2D9J4_9BACT|nr:MAG: co-chaperone GroES [Candidatus Lloydbacteria bacterium RIFCSPHIGHO2_02_FULL_51_22]OGZ14856.1 MAG: co-chaperone GroES [Candidatus Lloydbacteria bacterium RIFCSPLOWO2_02_FULL_51_11]OGZ16492.1 MAG: co-chaperone GroES [Candidatus Lloydbacteria bacterium RIFCSPLOWO2_12_FULL_51_9]
MSKKEIIPLGDRVLVKPAEKEKKTKSGIIIPDTVDKERPEIGKVVAVGAGKVTDEGKVIPLKVKAGDTVLFSKYGPDEVKYEGEEYLIVSESNILAIIK